MVRCATANKMFSTVGAAYRIRGCPLPAECVCRSYRDLIPQLVQLSSPALVGTPAKHDTSAPEFLDGRHFDQPHDSCNPTNALSTLKLSLLLVMTFNILQ